jgi:hypothetical protein
MLQQTAKHIGQPLIPLIPVVSARAGVKLEVKFPLGKQRGEPAVRR